MVFSAATLTTLLLMVFSAVMLTPQSKFMPFLGASLWPSPHVFLIFNFKSEALPIYTLHVILRSQSIGCVLISMNQSYGTIVELIEFLFHNIN